ncbi:hypothetical protein [Mesorhizobium sp.]|uniref:GNAT family N-acetyltransferase n=1 Tax=Mesorhizobium sp. TaxID=1871066 RepID=UPI0025D0F3B8|nr:hypothetical protein [Mesorhizobium sp.]
MAAAQIHHPNFAVPQALAAYPSQGHIDLLPQARGKVIGRRAMVFLDQRLAACGSTGLCLEVMRRNIDALNFYKAVGFRAGASPDVPRRRRSKAAPMHSVRYQNFNIGLPEVGTATLVSSVQAKSLPLPQHHSSPLVRKRGGRDSDGGSRA